MEQPTPFYISNYVTLRDYMKLPFGQKVLLQFLIPQSFFFSFLQCFETGSCYVVLVDQVLVYVAQAGLWSNPPASASECYHRCAPTTPRFRFLWVFNWKFRDTTGIVVMSPVLHVGNLADGFSFLHCPLSIVVITQRTSQKCVKLSGITVVSLHRSLPAWVNYSDSVLPPPRTWEKQTKMRFIEES